MLRHCLVLSLTVLLWGAGAAYAAPLARVVAVINGEMITSRELDKAATPELTAKKLDSSNPGDAAEIEAIKRRTLEGMIHQKILMQEAEKRNIRVSDEMVDEEMERFIADSQLSREEFQRQLAQQGLTPDAVRERLRSNIITQQLISRMVVNKVVVTDEEIAAYYREHMLDLPGGQVHIALLIYPADQDAEAWARRIASGAISFADAARQVSVGPNAQEGGDMGVMNLDDLAPGLRTEVETLKKGQISGPFDMQLNKAQVWLKDSITSDEALRANDAPDEATAARIEEILRAPRLEARFQEYTEQLRNRALVDIRY
ncbi:MAG: SurA N-terminal domain-containing protein [Desulfovibrionaceae bacterium]|nr:SurA N-terminal domain-containing protein [Desulfovibrionaceae bacterium]